MNGPESTITGKVKQGPEILGDPVCPAWIQLSDKKKEEFCFTFCTNKM